MPNYEFKQLPTLVNYIKKEQFRDDEYCGSVLLHDFDLDTTIDVLKSAHMPVVEIIEFIIASNPVLWAQYWLRNPQNPAEPLKLFFYQKNLLNCKNKYKLTRTGRQVGKTVCMTTDVLYHAMTSEHLRILYVAPYQSQVKVMFEDTLMPLIYDVPEIKNAIAKAPSHPYYQAIWKNGSEIKAMTAGTRSGQKGAGIRGIPGIDRLYMDEIDYMGEAAIAAVSAVTLAKPNSVIWVSSTPTGKREQFYHWAMDTNSIYRCPQCVSYGVDGSPFHYQSHVNPLFTDEVDRAFKQSMPAHEYAHEILGDWGEEVEGVFRHTDIDHCLGLGKIQIGEDSETGEINVVPYKFSDLTPDNRCVYILGVDWNTESTGVQLCVMEYNNSTEVINHLPPKMYRVYRCEVITAKEFTEDGAVSRIMALDRALPLAYIYCDEGYGTTQIEALKRIAMNRNQIGLARKIVAINMSSTHEVYDPLTRQKVKKAMKPFMVDNSSRIVHARRIILPTSEDEKVKLVGQMREYTVVRRGDGGRPVYSADNEDMLTAFMLALLGFGIEFSELSKLPLINKIIVSKDTMVTKRLTDNISQRWQDSNGSDNIFEDHGVPRRRPALRELVEDLGLPYSYTTDSRPEDRRPPAPVVANYQRSMRDTRRAGGGGHSRSGRPSRRKF